jgi:hypothetical protein
MVLFTLGVASVAECGGGQQAAVLIVFVGTIFIHVLGARSCPQSTKNMTKT